MSPRRGRVVVSARSSLAHSMFCTCSRNCSTTALRSRPIARQRHVVRLGGKRVGLAAEFLGEEIEPAADGAAVAQKRARRGDMRRQPVELLAHVGLGREHHGLLVQPVGIERRRGVEQRGDLRLELARTASARRAGAVSIAADEPFHRLELPGEDARQRPSFGAPRLGERRDGARDAGLERVGKLGTRRRVGPRPRSRRRRARQAARRRRQARRRAAASGGRRHRAARRAPPR